MTIVMSARERPDGLDITAADMKRELQDDRAPSVIKSFYKDKNVLITGGTGFLGNLIIEKLLRTCSDLNKIYLLIRPKKGKDIHKRFEEIFDGVVFEQLKSKLCLEKKVELISGDCAEVKLGLSEDDRQTLIDNVNVIFHVAATVRFDEKLKLATYINVRGTYEVLQLGKEMKNLQSVVHVSTAYSNCTMPVIDEKVYPPLMSFERLISLVESMDDDYLEGITKTTLGPYPNTYVFTKQLAEDVVRHYSNELPVVIVRPSIVTGTAKEPISGWINNMYGVTGIIAGAALGILRTLYCDPNRIADLVPADLVVNCIIASSWEIAQNKKIQTTVPVYNYVSSPQNPITWAEVMKFTEVAGEDIPSPMAVWHYWFKLNPNKYIHLIYTILFHFLPAIIVDTGARLLKKKPMMIKVYKKIYKIGSMFEYFTIRQFRFQNNNVRELYNKLLPIDKELFNFDITSFKWQEYYFVYIRGMRVYLINDPLETVPEGKKKRLQLKMAHYTITGVLLLLLFFTFWSKVSNLFS